MRADDFTFSRSRYLTYRYMPLLFANPVGAFIFRHLALNAPVLRAAYARTNNAKHKFAQANGPEQFDRMMDMEIQLWQ
jgi:hypothetical protein